MICVVCAIIYQEKQFENLCSWRTRCIENSLMAFGCCLLYCRVVVSLTSFPFSILYYLESLLWKVKKNIIAVSYIFHVSRLEFLPEGCRFKGVNRSVTNGQTDGQTMELTVALCYYYPSKHRWGKEITLSEKNAVPGKEKVGVSTKTFQGDMKVIKGKIPYKMTQNGL